MGLKIEGVAVAGDMGVEGGGQEGEVELTMTIVP